jgi:hypothetical protein
MYLLVIEGRWCEERLASGCRVGGYIGYSTYLGS